MGTGTSHSTQEARERLNESRRKPQKQNSVGRWTAEEHQWFLKGLEMFQGPSWGVKLLVLLVQELLPKYEPMLKSFLQKWHV